MNLEPNIFIVSNRLPVTRKQQPDGSVTLVKSAGGLVSGLSDVHRRGEALWVGHGGVFADRPDYATSSRELLEARYVSVPLQEDEYSAYYTGLSNGALWPVFHYFPGEARFDQTEWKAYVEVSRKFADTVLGLARPGDRIWVHDYQLLLVPGMLREAQPELQIAYFHHIPFPAPDLFRILPWRTALLEGLLGADLIGMHTLEYVMHFQASVSRILGGAVEKEQIRYRGRVSRLGAFPLGVDVESIRASVRGLSSEGRIAELAQVTEGKTVFLGIDRLDYTKGIPERLRAFGMFLKEHPEAIGQVVFVQVCVPSREEVPSYVALRAETERLVGQINGEFGRPGYVPLHYLYQPFSPEEVRQLYKLGNVALVTPLRDGLNLVCKEYVASRDDDDGVLVLSEFAGAAAEMGEAILVNPFDVTGMARALQEAFTMPMEERRRRMRSLKARVTQGNNIEWSRSFMRAWTRVVDSETTRSSQRLEGEQVARVVRQIAGAPRQFLFLDYDGTLVPIRNRPDQAVPAVRTLRLLHGLASVPTVSLALITGRSPKFCDQYFANLRIAVAAEHAGFFRLAGARSWEAASDPAEFERIKADVLPHFKSYVQRIPGANIEQKETALVLHYREADSVFAHQQAFDLREQLSRILENTPYSAFHAKRAIEVKPISANKGRAVERFLEVWGHRDEEFLTTGDDATDEDMFHVQPERNLSIYVGGPNTVARHHLDTPEALEALLEALIAELGGGRAPARERSRTS